MSNVKTVKLTFTHFKNTEGSFPLTGDSYNIMCYVREKNSIGNIFKITTLIIRSWIDDLIRYLIAFKDHSSTLVSLNIQIKGGGLLF
jgi:hypothetical protein